MLLKGMSSATPPLRWVYSETASSLDTILQAYACNAVLHASYASRSSRKRLNHSPMERIFRILDMNFREFLFHALD
jgi:hypothetical protein